MSALTDYYAKKRTNQAVTQDDVRAAQEALAAERAAYMAAHPGVSLQQAGQAVMGAAGSPYVNASQTGYNVMQPGETMEQYQARMRAMASTQPVAATTGTTGMSGTYNPPSAPGTSEGEMKMGTKDGQPHTFYWYGGQWLTSEEWASLGTTTGTGGTGGTGGFSDVLTGGTSNPNTEETYSPFTAYLQAKGLGTQNYYNPAQNYMINQYEPLSSIYDVRRLMSLVNPSYDPGNYVSPWAAANTGNATSLSRNTLSQLLGFNQEQQGLAGLDFSPQYNGTDEVGTGNRGYLQGLLKTGLRGVLGNYLASKIPWEQQQWGNTQASGGSGTFLDYLKQKYNLGSLVG